MVKALTKTVFGVPFTELVNRIESSDAVSAARAAGYRFEARLGELGRQYDAKAAELRDEYLSTTFPPRAPGGWEGSGQLPRAPPYRQAASNRYRSTALGQLYKRAHYPNFSL